MRQHEGKLPKVETFDLHNHLPQTAAEKTNDLFYILCTLHLANRADEQLTKFSLFKTLFAISSELGIKDNLKFLNTMFYANTYGPFNNVFYKYLDELESAELLKVEEKDIYLTAKGLSFTAEILEELPLSVNLKKILVELQKKALEYAKDPAASIKQTHALHIIDTTDADKQKTINELIKEIEPEKSFPESTEFKYINPLVDPDIEKVILPDNVINKIEIATAKVTKADFEFNEDLSLLFP